MKRIIFTPIGGKIILFSLVVLFIAGCSKRESDTTSAPQITNVKITPSSIVYDGRQNPTTKATIDFVVKGNPVPTVVEEGNPEQPLYGHLVTPELLSTQTFVLKGSNSYGVTSVSVTVPVVIDPVIDLLSNHGSWIMKSSKVDGVEYTFTCEADDTTTFFPHGRWETTYGSLCSQTGSGVGSYYLANNKQMIKGWGADFAIVELTQTRLRVTTTAAGSGATVEFLFEH